jgi:hypothetical protein
MQFRFAKLLGRGVTFAAALALAAALTIPSPSQARVSDGAAVGIGLGSFALGTALGSTANPYYNGYYYPYNGYYAAPAAPGYYYPAAPAPAARTCWDPYRRYYYYC